ncbi:unnamed protein product [Trichogramma brassicae]|uniref:Serpin domain-containing protein n=1 Tax=Trichogramma brassicae TaxID=86971 RepID=A0A6H5I4F4_9HYME|nr:unnamed protein product [Trichogramma brassicae]
MPPTLLARAHYRNLDGRFHVRTLSVSDERVTLRNLHLTKRVAYVLYAAFARAPVHIRIHVQSYTQAVSTHASMLVPHGGDRAQRDREKVNIAERASERQRHTRVLYNACGAYTASCTHCSLGCVYDSSPIRVLTTCCTPDIEGIRGGNFVDFPGARCYVKCIMGLMKTDGYPIRQEFRALIEVLYKSDIINVEYSDGQKAFETINNWVSEKTKGNIKTLFDQAPDSDTRVVLASALYFNGKWALEFNPENTVKFVNLKHSEDYYNE